MTSKWRRRRFYYTESPSKTLVDLAAGDYLVALNSDVGYDTRRCCRPRLVPSLPSFNILDAPSQRSGSHYRSATDRRQHTSFLLVDVLEVASRLDAATTSTFSAAIAEVSTRSDDRVLTTPVVCQSVDPVVEPNYTDFRFDSKTSLRRRTQLCQPGDRPSRHHRTLL